MNATRLFDDNQGLVDFMVNRICPVRGGYDTEDFI